MVQGAVKALQDFGLKWPDQVDVAGFGAPTPARLYRPPLILVEQPTREMGRMAIELLLEQMRGGGAITQQHFVLQNRLIRREEWAQVTLDHTHNIKLYHSKDRKGDHP